MSRHPLAKHFSSDKTNYYALTDRIKSLIERWDAFAEREPLVDESALIKGLLLEILDDFTNALLEPFGLKVTMVNYEAVQESLRKKLRRSSSNEDKGFNDGINV